MNLNLFSEPVVDIVKTGQNGLPYIGLFEKKHNYAMVYDHIDAEAYLYLKRRNHAIKRQAEKQNGRAVNHKRDAVRSLKRAHISEWENPEWEADGESEKATPVCYDGKYDDYYDEAVLSKENLEVVEFVTRCCDTFTRMALGNTDGWLYCGYEEWRRLKRQAVSEFVTEFIAEFGRKED